MIFNDPRFNNHMGGLIFSSLLPKALLKATSTCKLFHNLAKSSLIWQKMGAKDYADFIEKVKTLPSPLRKLVLRKCFNLTEAMEVAKYIRPGANNLASFFIREDILQRMVRGPFREYNFNSDYPIIALAHGLVLPVEFLYAQNHSASNVTCCDYLFSENGIIALKQTLITFPQAASLRDPHKLKFLLSENGLTALRDKLVTLDEISSITNIKALTSLLSDNGIIALREKLFTIKQINSVACDAILDFLFSNSGLAALREKLIAVDQVNLSQTKKEYLPSGAFFNHENILIALREGLITGEQIQKHPDSAYNFFYFLFFESGLQALRNKSITIDKIADMEHYVLDHVLEESYKTNDKRSKFSPY